MNANKVSNSQILVYTKDVCNRLLLASFKHCLFEQLGVNGFNCSRFQVACYLQNNKLILERTDCDSDASLYPDQRIGKPIQPLYTFCHPSFCPVLNISELERDTIPEEVSSRGVNVAVAVLLESSDGCVLLTRRAAHMRTFPGIWVPPGGHIEIDETLEEAGLRELFEETGLTFDPLNKCSTILGLWESVYPPVLGIGLPLRHHIVVYVRYLAGKPSVILEKDLKLAPAEVDASIWLPKRIIAGIVTEEVLSEEKLYITTVNKQGDHQFEILDTSVLQEKLPPPVGQGERISTGTRFALELWLAEKLKCSTHEHLESRL